MASSYLPPPYLPGVQYPQTCLPVEYPCWEVMGSLLCFQRAEAERSSTLEPPRFSEEDDGPKPMDIEEIDLKTEEVITEDEIKKIEEVAQEVAQRRRTPKLRLRVTPYRQPHQPAMIKRLTSKATMSYPDEIRKYLCRRCKNYYGPKNIANHHCWTCPPWK